MLLIKNAVIVDPGAKLNGQKRDVLIEKGIITSIASRISKPRARMVDADGACLSIGWMDVGVHTGDPGYEHRETLETIAQAAMAGGYTALACWPNTQPEIHSKSEVHYILRSTKGGMIDFHPIGAISRACKGKDITEMYDMYASGAIAFSDGSAPVQNSGLMIRALQYVKPFNGLIINQPQDEAIAANGHMHEGIQSTRMGTKGIPSLAEELMVNRDIYLLEYTASRLHLANISTAGAVDLVRRAKSRGLQLTASVAALNLAYDDSVLSEFDSLFKLSPPLREKSDIRALKNGLKNGAIDFISSNHCPLEEEAKKLEFPYASFGAIGLESCYALCNTHLADTLDTEALVRLLGYQPRKILNLPVPTIEAGKPANLTLFDPEKEWTFENTDIRSRSHNTPLIGKKLKGKVIGVFNNGSTSIG